MGYSDTTGLQSMDYFITDAHVCPDSDERYIVESVERLPTYFLCYSPNPAAPEVAPPPLTGNGHVTFGSFNSLAKINSEVVSVWSDILHQLPDARLCLKTGALADPDVRTRYVRLFEEHGVASERLTLLPRSSSWREYARTFEQIDIALDPFPFNGGTTSMDGLWMGVPFVSLTGDRPVGRFGKGILSGLGLSELVAGSREAYVRTAVALARDPARIAALRRGLRQRMVTSRLCDAAGFTRSLESTYQRMRHDCRRSR
jgi:predicted O-linked N-acetylglucosamine transferase (SPINDLY family)